jgi:IS5 family transposase
MTNFQEFVWQDYDLVKQALPKYSTKYSRKDFTQHQLAVLLLIWAKCDHGYRGTVDMVRLMTPIRDHPGLDTMPDPSTLCHALDRMSLTLGRLLLSESLEPFDLSGFCGIDATGFERTGASQYYAKTAKMNIKSIKTTVLADLEKNVVMDVHFTTTRKHDTQIGPQLLKKHSDLSALAADKGYDDQSFRDQLRDDNIRPLIRHCESSPIHKAANARMNDEDYHKRSNNESVFSAIKRKYGDRLRSRTWYRQFRELILKMVVHNIDQLVKEHLFIATIFWFLYRRKSLTR